MIGGAAVESRLAIRSSMQWAKRGLIFAPDGSSPWARHSALQPTPWLKDDTTIRVFVGMRDNGGVSRVGFVDVAVDDPGRVLGVSTRPVLDIGEPGAFDDNGVVPTAVVRRGEELLLYYAGYQLQHRVRFHVFCGLAVSSDGGASFQRVRRVPVMDRTDEETLFRVLHSIRFEAPRWRAWYGGGSEFVAAAEPGHTHPVYNIRYIESPDGVHFPDHGATALDLAGDEYRLGRPYVLHDGVRYRMFFAAARRSSSYRLAYAESPDGHAWTRDDEALGLELSADGWDSEMMSYPSVVETRGGTYLFYNGNSYGATGFGYAELL